MMERTRTRIPHDRVRYMQGCNIHVDDAPSRADSCDSACRAAPSQTPRKLHAKWHAHLHPRQRHCRYYHNEVTATKFAALTHRRSAANSRNRIASYGHPPPPPPCIFPRASHGIFCPGRLLPCTNPLEKHRI